MEWAVRNLARGVSPHELVATLVNGGVPREIAAREVEYIARSPLSAPWHESLRELDRLGELVELQQALRNADPLEERPSAIDAATFYERHWATNTPVVLRGYVGTWARPFRPTFAELRARFGPVEIEITEGRNRFDDPGPHFEELRHRTTLGTFLDELERAPSNDRYLVARNAALGGPLAPLLHDIEPPSDLFDLERRAEGISLWLGPAGTLTRLHHDETNNLFCQILGRKRITLVPPWETSIAQTAFGYYAKLRADAPELRASAKHVVLEPGDAVFLPVGWWHEVESLSPSLSLALVGFRRPNVYRYCPGRRA